MEDDLNGRRRQWRMTSMEEDLNGIQPKGKKTSIEEYFNESQSQWKPRKQMKRRNLAPANQPARNLYMLCSWLVVLLTSVTSLNFFLHWSLKWPRMLQFLHFFPNAGQLSFLRSMLGCLQWPFFPQYLYLTLAETCSWTLLTWLLDSP